MQLNQDDFVDLKHLLPPSFAGLVEMIGLAMAFELVEKFGGTTFPIGKNKTNQGKVLHHLLAEIIGEDNADKIEIALNGQRELYVPKCQVALLTCRNREIRRQFDELTTRPNYPMTGVCAVNNLAREYHLSARQIWNIVNSGETMQQSLFS